jgi:DNA-binding NarL/FixJ family response regulator
MFVAIIDDFPLIRTELRKIVSEAGFSIAFEAGNGRECLQKLATGNTIPGLCILDIEMPLLNGYDTAREIKKAWPEIKIIMYSVANDEQIKVKSLESGADAFLNKGCEPDELLAAVHSQVGIRGAIPFIHSRWSRT